MCAWMMHSHTPLKYRTAKHAHNIIYKYFLLLIGVRSINTA